MPARCLYGPSRYDRDDDRFYHRDGTDNRPASEQGCADSSKGSVWLAYGSNTSSGLPPCAGASAK
jgi:hypothetical protein